MEKRTSPLPKNCNECVITITGIYDPTFPLPLAGKQLEHNLIVFAAMDTAN